jgi:hypothetical protein
MMMFFGVYSILMLSYPCAIGKKAQYGHSQSEKKLGLGDKYHRSIKVHT